MTKESKIISAMGGFIWSRGFLLTRQTCLLKRLRRPVQGFEKNSLSFLPFSLPGVFRRIVRLIMGISGFSIGDNFGIKLVFSGHEGKPLE
jgi:hypothetical protein